MRQDRSASVVFGRRWVHGTWPDPWKAFNIAILWSLMEDENSLSFSDVAAIIDIINHQTPEDQGIMVL